MLRLHPVLGRWTRGSRSQRQEQETRYWQTDKKRRTLPSHTLISEVAS